MKFNLEELADKPLHKLTEEEFLAVMWGENGIRLIDDYYNGELPNFDMSMKEFLSHCTACGGNWSGMLLTGIRELSPIIYSEIPDELGIDGTSGFVALNILLKMLGVTVDK